MVEVFDDLIQSHSPRDASGYGLPRYLHRRCTLLCILHLDRLGPVTVSLLLTIMESLEGLIGWIDTLPQVRIIVRGSYHPLQNVGGKKLILSAQLRAPSFGCLKDLRV